MADFERCASPERVFVERIRRGAELIDAAPETVLRSGDVVAIGARRKVLLGGSLSLGEKSRTLRCSTSDGDSRRGGDKAEAIEQPLSALAQQHGRGVVSS